MTGEELITIIQSSEFESLFQKHDFHKVYEWKDANDVHSNRNRYIIGYDSPECRIAFYYEPGAVAVLIGTTIDKFDILRFSSLESSGWVGLNDLVSYFLKRSIKWYSVSEEDAYQKRILNSLNETTNDFESLSDQIIPMFRDPDVLVQLKPRIDTYKREEIKRRFGVTNTK
jgi:hypothetical protein